MAVIEINGFKLFESIETRALIIESDRINECMSFCEEQNILKISISRYYGYKKKDIEFLKDYPKIKEISIMDEFIDMSGIRYLIGLKKFSLNNKKQAIDFSNFPELEKCSFSWNNQIKNINKSKKLRELHISKFNPKEKDLTKLSGLKNLEFLELIRTNINSFTGLNNLSKLSKLELHYARNIEFLKDIENASETLEHLSLNSLPKLKDHSDVTKLKKLTWLKLNKCSDIPSINFIKQMSKLEKFAFVDTTVTDGDITPCICLKHAGFINKTLYS